MAAGVGATMAQSNVYSLNVVGYVNVTVKPGFQIVVNPLDDGAGNYLTNVIANSTLDVLPDGSVLYPWAGSGYGGLQGFFNGFGWFDSVLSSYSTNQIPPGKAFFLNLPPGTNANITFVGTVQQGSTTNALGAGFTLTGSTEPVSVPVGINTDGLNQATMQLPVEDSDTLYLFSNPGGYTLSSYFAGYGWFDPANGSLSTNGYAPAVAQGFFINKAHAASWVQSFTVQ